MNRVIYKCRSKACKHVWAFDYPESRKAYRGYGRYETVCFRTDENGRNIDLGYDGACPSCGLVNSSATRVRGFVTEHVCDARCTGAKGPNCECSCGGKNHGNDFMVGVTADLGVPA